MKTHTRTLGLAIAAAGLTALLALPAAQAQKADPFVGTWNLDPVKSTFTPGPGPENRHMTIEMTHDGGFHHTTFTQTPFGGESFIEYTAKFDGKDYEVDGAVIDTVSLKRVDENTIERTGKQKSKEAETCTMKLSPDHKMLTMTIKGSANGVNYSSMQTYMRQ